METSELAEQAKRTWGEKDADAADSYIGLFSKVNPIQKTLSDVPETLPRDGQSPW